MKKLLLPIILYLLLYSISFGQAYDIYVCDGGNYNIPPWQILKFDEDGNNAEVYINEQLSWPQDIVFIEDQEIVLISNLNSGRITKYNAEDGAYVGNFAINIDGPTRMKIGGDGYLYVLQWGNNGKVLRYNLDGTLVGAFTNSGVTNSIGLDWDIEGNLYVSSYNGNFIRKYNSNGEDQGNLISSGLQGPTNIWFDENGDLFVNNWNGTTVKRFDSNGVFIEDFITGLSNPEGISIFPNGNLLIGNGGTSAVKLFGPDGNFIEDIVASGTLGLILPNAVVIRAKEPNSIKEETISVNYLRTNLGSNFKLNNDFIAEIKRVEVYTLNGELIINRQVVGDLVWAAENALDGMYIIKAITEDRKNYIQKVMVVH